MTGQASHPLRFLYIHGFKSSPASGKAQAFADYCRRHHPQAEVVIPALNHDPARAIDQLEAVFANPGGVTLLVGSSLGAYYATWLSEKYNTRAVLVNPAVSPHKHLGQEFLGSHVNYHSGEQFELTLEHVATLASLECRQLCRPENFLLLLQTGDEVLDYRLAAAHYRGSEQIIQEGGDHSFTDFEAMLPRILAFAGFH